MDDGVDAELPNQLAYDRLPSVGVDEVHLLDRADGIGHIAPEQGWHLSCEPPRHLGGERIGNAGDENAARIRTNQGWGHPLIMGKSLSPSSRWPPAERRSRRPRAACRCAWSPTSGGSRSKPA